MRLTSLTLLGTLAGPASLAALAQGHDVHARAPQPAPAVRAPEQIRGPAAPFSQFPTPAFDARGKLWVAFVEGPAVYVASSPDLGRSFERAVRVNPAPEAIDANGEGRPKLAVSPSGTILVTWTQKLDKPYTGRIRFSRSTDWGRSFTAPTTLNDDGLVTGHRFEVLGVSPRGEVVVAWIDKRDLEAATARKQAYAGAAIYFATSRDDGRSFGPNRKLRDHACECCRLALAFDAAGEPVLLWRDILPGGIRDHSLARLATDPPFLPVRATFDDWSINACPHHGPSLSIGADGTLHLAWFSGDGPRPGGAFYARSTDGGKTVGSAIRLGSAESASHPSVLTAGGQLLVAWKESGDGGARILTARWDERKAGFDTLAVAASTRNGSDHPLLVAGRGRVYLSWFTADEGYRLIPLTLVAVAAEPAANAAARGSASGSGGTVR
jgi:hypothetical protein